MPERKNKLVLNKKSCLKQQQRRQRLNSLFSNRKFESFSRFKAKHNRSSLKFQKSSNTFYFRTETFSLSAKTFLWERIQFFTLSELFQEEETETGRQSGWISRTRHQPEGIGEVSSRNSRGFHRKSAQYQGGRS